MRPQLVFIHGIGGPRDPARELTQWTSALASGMRAAGHARLGRELTAGSGTECVFAHYADLFGQRQAQGEPDGLPEEAQADVLSDLLVAWVDALAAEDVSERDRRLLAHARAEAAPRDQAQGSLEVVRRAINVATTVLSLKPWSGPAQWITPKLMVRHLAQVARYLARGEHDDDGVGLDRRVRARVAEALGDGPVVVVAHSLGTVVALEALHEHPSDIRLLVTLGSPIAMRTVVWPRLVPQPPSTPATVAEWLNFWDRDDVIAVRPHLERDVRANLAGVAPVSSRIDSDGVWVHSADKYLAQPAVAGRVAEALMSLASGPSGDSV